MKKITLLFLMGLVFSFIGYAQNTCLTATVITTGSHSATAIVANPAGIPMPICAANGAGATGGKWYSFTASVDGVANVTTDISANFSGEDTRVHVYTGSCGSLVCVGGHDDVDNANFLSNLTWPVSNGTTYIIAFDNRWTGFGGELPFDFELTEPIVNCPDGSLPISEDFSDTGRFLICWKNIDDDGDGQSWFVNDYDLNPPAGPDGDPVLGSASWNGAPLTPDNWLVSYAIDLTAYAPTDIIDLTWVARGLDPAFPAENYSVYAANSNLIANLEVSPVVFTETLVDGGEGDGNWTPTRTLDISSLAGQMVYIAFRHHGVSDQFVLNIDNVAITGVLGIGDFESNTFKHFYNKDSDILTLDSSNSSFDNIELYNLLGQQVLNKNLSSSRETIDLSSLNDGIYIGKIRIDNNTQTIKLIKN